MAALAEQRRQRGSGEATAGSAVEVSAAQGLRRQLSGGGDGGGGSSASVSSGEAGLQGGSNGGGRALATVAARRQWQKWGGSVGCAVAALAERQRQRVLKNVQKHKRKEGAKQEPVPCLVGR